MIEAVQGNTFNACFHGGLSLMLAGGAEITRRLSIGWALDSLAKRPAIAVAVEQLDKVKS